MVICKLSTVVVALVIIAAAAPLQARDSKKGKDHKDEVVGAVWSYTLSKEGEEDVKGQFRVSDNVIYKGSEKVGTVKPADKDDTTLVFNNWSEMNGTATLKKARNGHAAGTLIKKDKSEWKMVVNWKDG